jgi:hypothetical protein
VIFDFELSSLKITGIIEKIFQGIIMPEEPTTPQSTFSDAQIVTSRVSEPNKPNNIESHQSDRVADIEKISRIIAPYFTVLVGLYLYKSNFWIGFLFIGLGMLALLKISIADVKKAIAGIKSFLGLQEE